MKLLERLFGPRQEPLRHVQNIDHAKSALRAKWRSRMDREQCNDVWAYDGVLVGEKSYDVTFRNLLYDLNVVSLDHLVKTKRYRTWVDFMGSAEALEKPEVLRKIFALRKQNVDSHLADKYVTRAREASVYLRKQKIEDNIYVDTHNRYMKLAEDGKRVVVEADILEQQGWDKFHASMRRTSLRHFDFATFRPQGPFRGKSYIDEAINLKPSESGAYAVFEELFLRCVDVINPDGGVMFAQFPSSINSHRRHFASVMRKHGVSCRFAIDAHNPCDYVIYMQRRKVNK